MAKQGKPLGNKRQRERDKRRKKEEKAARRLSNTGDQSGARSVDTDGDPVDGEASATDPSVESEPNQDVPSLPPESADADVRRAP